MKNRIENLSKTYDVLETMLDAEFKRVTKDRQICFTIIHPQINVSNNYLKGYLIVEEIKNRKILGYLVGEYDSWVEFEDSQDDYEEFEFKHILDIKDKISLLEYIADELDTYENSKKVQ